MARLPWYLGYKKIEYKDGKMFLTIKPNWAWIKWVQLRIVLKWIFNGFKIIE